MCRERVVVEGLPLQYALELDIVAVVAVEAAIGPLADTWSAEDSVSSEELSTHGGSSCGGDRSAKGDECS